MSDPKYKVVDASGIQMEDGAEELLNSPEMQPYSRYIEAAMFGGDVDPSVREIAALPLEKRYVWRVASALKWESRLPVLERRTSVGRHGRRFDMLMFRTTVCDPRHRCAQRTTPLGEFIRHSRIELLPQLINVIRGEMSLINPDDRSASFLE